jgi:hypothetical protein
VRRSRTVDLDVIQIGLSVNGVIIHEAEKSRRECEDRRVGAFPPPPSVSVRAFHWRV